MLSIDFTARDLGRLRVAGDPDPMWETVLSLHVLYGREAPLVFDPWRREVRARLRRAGLAGTASALLRLCPPAAYFPDFLTPGGTGPGIEEGVDRVLSTPRTVLAAELTRLAQHGPLPPWARHLAAGDVTALTRLGAALRAYHAAAVAPYREAVRSAVAEDVRARAQTVLRYGAEGLLDGYQPELARRGGTLECAYPFDRELPLRGRPLTLVPSFFCVRWPVTLADSELPPVLVYPLSPAPGWLRPGAAAPDAGALPLGRLLGTRRAQVLALLDEACTTTRIAAELRIALASASRHASVLRDAGLISSHRDGYHVLHRRTALGEAVLSGTAGPVPAFPRPAPPAHGTGTAAARRAG
ncbi:winged helix-turn-helix domain-containing protein [Streptomyces sp. NPDC051940]|uniref:ArsR/SmtB family transcription factor n=1 Tax=Streptomyces sp. NPDC051940 TaxID=3155675 RepID=UPI003429FE28